MGAEQSAEATAVDAETAAATKLQSMTRGRNARKQNPYGSERRIEDCFFLTHSACESVGILAQNIRDGSHVLASMRALARTQARPSRLQG